MVALGIAIGVGGLMMKNDRTLNLVPNAEAAPSEAGCVLVQERIPDALMVKVNNLYQQGYRVKAMSYFPSYRSDEAPYKAVMLCVE